MEFNRLSFVSTSSFSSPQVREDTPKNKRRQTQISTQTPESEKGADMSGGDVVCSGWLRKSPPEKKLRRYVSALYIVFVTL